MADPVKPPLSSPMVEAMAEDAAEAAARAAQAAPATQEPTAPEPVEAASEAHEGGEPAPAVEPEPAPKPKRTTQDVMTARISALTAQKTEAERIAREARQQNEALRKLLDAQGRPLEGDAAPVADSTTPRTFSEADVLAQADRIAQRREFDRRSNDTFQAGQEKYGDWTQKIGELQAAVPMTQELIEAVLDTGQAVDVFHHLAENIDEADRIHALPPHRMGVELGKIAAKLGAPKAATVRVSNAPAPISPITGVSSPVTDYVKLANGDDMNAWVEARKKAGDPYATGRGRR